MTKVLVEMEPELWSQARAYAKEHDLTNNDLMRLAVERLVHPVAGRPIHERMAHLRETTPIRDVTPLVYEAQAHPHLAGPSFGYSRPVPKPMKKGR